MIENISDDNQQRDSKINTVEANILHAKQSTEKLEKELKDLR